MTIRVTPESYQFVAFDSAYIARIAARVTALLHVEDLNFHIDVEETSPLTRVFVDVTPELVTITPHSGALEDTRLPRQQSEKATTVTLARGMMRARDRIRGGFENAPPDLDLTLAQNAAWDTYILGRISRLDIEIKQQACLYNFRNRHGFNDISDSVFVRLWSSESLSWEELDALSVSALSVSA